MLAQGVGQSSSFVACTYVFIFAFTFVNEKNSNTYCSVLDNCPNRPRKQCVTSLTVVSYDD